MITFAIILIAYIIHIILCRKLYIKLINIDNIYEENSAYILWFIPLIGLFLLVLAFIISSTENYKQKGSWFNPKSKKNND